MCPTRRSHRGKEKNYGQAHFIPDVVIIVLKVQSMQLKCYSNIEDLE